MYRASKKGASFQMPDGSTRTYGAFEPIKEKPEDVPNFFIMVRRKRILEGKGNPAEKKDLGVAPVEKAPEAEVAAPSPKKSSRKKASKRKSSGKKKSSRKKGKK